MLNLRNHSQAHSRTEDQVCLIIHSGQRGHQARLLTESHNFRWHEPGFPATVPMKAKRGNWNSWAFLPEGSQWFHSAKLGIWLFPALDSGLWTWEHFPVINVKRSLKPKTYLWCSPNNRHDSWTSKCKPPGVCMTCGPGSQGTASCIPPSPTRCPVEPPGAQDTRCLRTPWAENWSGGGGGFWAPKAPGLLLTCECETPGPLEPSMRLLPGFVFWRLCLPFYLQWPLRGLRHNHSWNRNWGGIAVSSVQTGWSLLSSTSPLLRAAATGCTRTDYFVK